MSGEGFSNPIDLAAAIAGAIPTPPSAAAIGAAVGGSVPVPPSAAAVGAEVSTQTNVLGIPNVLLTEQIHDNQGAAGAGSYTTPPLDISRYSSLIITAYAGTVVTVKQGQSVTGNALTATDIASADVGVVGSYAKAGAAQFNTLRVQCVAKYVQVTVSGYGTRVRVVGTNRPASRMIDGRYSAGLACRYGIAPYGTTRSFIAGNPYICDSLDDVRHEGTVKLRIQSNSSATKGIFYAQDFDGNRFFLGDTAELVSAEASVIAVQKEVVLPTNTLLIFFLCTTAGSANFSLLSNQVP